MISGETIRQTALERSETCPEAMKNSFYYGFREGAKWMQSVIIGKLKDAVPLDGDISKFVDDNFWDLV